MIIFYCRRCDTYWDRATNHLYGPELRCPREKNAAHGVGTPLEDMLSEVVTVNLLQEIRDELRKLTGPTS